MDQKNTPSRGSSWLTEMYELRNRIWAETRDLDDLAYAFGAVGNPIMAEKIQEMSNRLSNIAQAIELVTKQKVDNDYKQAVQSSANLLETALAVGERKSG